ncbi:MAG: hypothetical protein DLM61_02790 [Pseudonocardiales bacterium]|nr:MAG: hypothetical protein DLM61_02790 [Pseudonocardiales bacterium]
MAGSPGRSELGDDVVAYIAAQVKVPPSDIAFYEWDGRTIEYHRAQIRTFTGFRECTAADAEKITGWLADHVCRPERRSDRVRVPTAGAAEQRGDRATRHEHAAPRTGHKAGGRSNVSFAACGISSSSRSPTPAPLS